MQAIPTGIEQPEVHIPGSGKVPGSPVASDGIHYWPPGPVARAYLRDESFVVGIRGPFRSGKSTASVMKLILNAQRQVPGPDGVRRRRTAIIRNTYPELRTTTMPTWFQWVPKNKGAWREAGPPMHHIVDARNKLDWEIWFVALDRPDDVSKLLSMELSDAWVNEAREIPKAIIDALTGRIGQYPARWQGGCTRPQLIMDTNPPDTDHWWYVLAEKDMSTERNRQIIQSVQEAEASLRAQGMLAEGQKLFSFHAQPSGRSRQAENTRNLRGGYYELLMAGKSPEFIRVYVDGEYGFVMDGRPVYPDYKDSVHSREFEVVPGVGIRIGFDFGLTPAATISQRLASGRWLVHDEFVSERLGVQTAAQEVARRIKERWPNAKVISVRCDPSGDAGKDVDPNTPIKILQANGFRIAQPAPTNDSMRRRSGLSFLLKNLVDGEPGILIHKRCATLRKGLSGGFHFRRLQVTGEDRYRDVPEKNIYSHVCEALEYDVVSAGEDRNVLVHEDYRDVSRRPKFAESDYDVFEY